MRALLPTTPRRLAAAWSLLAFLALLGACSGVPAPAWLPEPATGLHASEPVVARQQLVVTADGRASDAALAILRAGGSALDAAIAAELVLAVVEPQSSGLGGGALMLHWDGRAVEAWDGRETAPAGVDERLFLEGGRPMPFQRAVVGGRAVGVPGALRMLEAAHRRHGVLPWARLFEAAIAAAEQGFVVGARLHALLAGDADLARDPLARALYYRPGGAAHPVGHVLRNPALAEILRRAAREGSAALHTGAVARDLVARVHGHATNPGRLDGADLAGYQPRERAPICTPWKALYLVCGFPPPSAGHLVVMQILGMLEQRSPIAPPRAGALPGPEWLHEVGEAARLAMADRALHVADPDSVAAPGGDWASLLEPHYLRERAALIGPRSRPDAPAGHPRGAPVAWALQPEQPQHGTTHLSIVDASGRAVALTASIEAAFGARLMSDGGTGLRGGFLLNNQLTDFALAPADARGRPVANRVGPGKRPRSNMSPTLVFDARDGRLLMVLGSPLGLVIPHAVARTLIATLDWGLDLGAAIALPNLAVVDGSLVLERGRFPAATVEELRARGHAVVEADLATGLQAIVRTPDGWLGVADPRREGVARGD